ncbi:hypothetical protein LXL04_008930 [Taraxacum kok-saghyz]
MPPRLKTKFKPNIVNSALIIPFSVSSPDRNYNFISSDLQLQFHIGIAVFHPPPQSRQEITHHYFFTDSIFSVASPDRNYNFISSDFRLQFHIGIAVFHPPPQSRQEITHHYFCTDSIFSVVAFRSEVKISIVRQPRSAICNKNHAKSIDSRTLHFNSSNFSLSKVDLEFDNPLSSRQSTRMDIASIH